MEWNAARRADDPSVPSSSPRYHDGTGTPGDIVVASGVRKIACIPVVGLLLLTITHPDIKATSKALGSYEGNWSIAVPANRRPAVTCRAGAIDVSGSAPWLGGGTPDGYIMVTVEVI